MKIAEKILLIFKIIVPLEKTQQNVEKKNSRQ